MPGRTGIAGRERGRWGVQVRPGGKGGAIGDAGGFTCVEWVDSTREGGWIQPGRVDGFTCHEMALDALLIFTGECKCGGLNEGWRAVRGARVPHCPTCCPTCTFGGAVKKPYKSTTYERLPHLPHLPHFFRGWVAKTRTLQGVPSREGGWIHLP